MKKHKKTKVMIRDKQVKELYEISYLANTIQARIHFLAEQLQLKLNKKSRRYECE